MTDSAQSYIADMNSVTHEYHLSVIRALVAERDRYREAFESIELRAGSPAYEAMRSARDQYLARCDQLVVRAQRYETALRLLIADVGLGNVTVETVRAVRDALDQKQANE